MQIFEEQGKQKTAGQENGHGFKNFRRFLLIKNSCATSTICCFPSQLDVHKKARKGSMFEWIPV